MRRCSYRNRSSQSGTSSVAQAQRTWMPVTIAVRAKACSRTPSARSHTPAVCFRDIYRFLKWPQTRIYEELLINSINTCTRNLGSHISDILRFSTHKKLPIMTYTIYICAADYGAWDSTVFANKKKYVFEKFLDIFVRKPYIRLELRKERIKDGGNQSNFWDAPHTLLLRGVVKSIWVRIWPICTLTCDGELMNKSVFYLSKTIVAPLHWHQRDERLGRPGRKILTKKMEPSVHNSWLHSDCATTSLFQPIS